MKRLLLAITMLGLSSVTLPVEARMLFSRDISGWSLGAYTHDTTGEFSHCAVSVPYNGGVLLLFSVNAKYEWYMGFADTSWRLSSGATIEMDYSVDQGRWVHTQGTVLSRNLVAFPLLDSAQLFDAFRHGNRLNVNLRGRTFRFNLNNSSRALTAALECTRSYVGSGSYNNNPGNNPYLDRNAPQPYSSGPDRNNMQPSPYSTQPDSRDDRNILRPQQPNATQPQPYSTQPQPYSRQPQPQPQPYSSEPPRNTPTPRGSDASAPVVPNEDTKTEAAIVVANMLSASGLKGFRVLPPEEVPNNLRGYDAVWYAEGVAGTVNVLGADVANDSEAVAALLLSKDARACDGSFASAKPGPGESGVVRLMTGCDRNGQITQVRYTIAYRGKGGYYVFAVLGDANTRQPAQEVEQHVFDAALRVMPKR